MYNLYGTDLTFKMLCKKMVAFGYDDESDLSEDIIDILLEQGFVSFTKSDIVTKCDIEVTITTRIDFIVLAKANVLEKHLSESIIHITNII